MDARNRNDANTVFGFSLFKLSLPLPVHQTLTLYHVDFISYNHIKRYVEAPGPPATHFRALLGLNVLPQAVFKHQSCFGGWECANSFSQLKSADNISVMLISVQITYFHLPPVHGVKRCRYLGFIQLLHFCQTNIMTDLNYVCPSLETKSTAILYVSFFQKNCPHFFR